MTAIQYHLIMVRLRLDYIRLMLELIELEIASLEASPYGA